MRTEILNIVGEWLKPIKAQMELNNKAMLQGIAAQNSIPQTRAGILASIQSRLPATQTLDMSKIQRDMQLKSIFSRIKYSRMSREQRDSLSSTIRNLAADDRLTPDAIKKIFQVIFVVESSNGVKQDKKATVLLGGREKTVDDEMKTLNTLRSTRDAQKKTLTDLQTRFSALA